MTTEFFLIRDECISNIQAIRVALLKSYILLRWITHARSSRPHQSNRMIQKINNYNIRHWLTTTESVLKKIQILILKKYILKGNLFRFVFLLVSLFDTNLAINLYWRWFNKTEQEKMSSLNILTCDGISGYVMKWNVVLRETDQWKEANNEKTFLLRRRTK